VPAPHARADRLDQRAVVVDDQGGVGPLDVDAVRAADPQPLAEPDQPGVEVVAGDQDEVAAPEAG